MSSMTENLIKTKCKIQMSIHLDHESFNMLFYFSAYAQNPTVFVSYIYIYIACFKTLNTKQKSIKSYPAI